MLIIPVLIFYGQYRSIVTFKGGEVCFQPRFNCFYRNGQSNDLVLTNSISIMVAFDDAADQTILQQFWQPLGASPTPLGYRTYSILPSETPK